MLGWDDAPTMKTHGFQGSGEHGSVVIICYNFPRLLMTLDYSPPKKKHQSIREGCCGLKLSASASLADQALWPGNFRGGFTFRFGDDYSNHPKEIESCALSLFLLEFTVFFGGVGGYYRGNQWELQVEYRGKWCFFSGRHGHGVICKLCGPISGYLQQPWSIWDQPLLNIYIYIIIYI